MGPSLVKHLGFVTRKSDLSRDDFIAHWFDVHAPMCSRLPGLLRYSVNLILPGQSAFGAYDGFSELWFQTEDAVDAALESPEGIALLADLPNFVGSRVAVRVIEREVALSATLDQ